MSKREDRPTLQCEALCAGHRGDTRLSGSESDASDSEDMSGTGDRFKSSKARLAALACLQALERWDAKALHPLWLALLPVYAPLTARPQDATLLDVLARDPSSKVPSLILLPGSLKFLRSVA